MTPETADPAGPVRHDIQTHLTPDLDVDEAMLMRVWVQAQRRIADSAITETYAERVIDTVEPVAIPLLAFALERDAQTVAQVLGHVEDLAIQIEEMIREL
jgi:hypothetical protein